MWNDDSHWEAEAPLGIVPPLDCETCHGTHQIQVPDPRDSAWLPRKPLTRPCPDCAQQETK